MTAPLDLWSATPADIQNLMSNTTDIETLKALAALEDAALAGDEEARVEAVERLLERVVLEGGGGW